MSEEGLKREIAKLTKERDVLLADLRAERGEQLPDEICVSRWGTYQSDPTTFHVRLSVDIMKAAKFGDQYVEDMLSQMRSMVDGELRRRGAKKARSLAAALKAQKNRLGACPAASKSSTVSDVSQTALPAPSSPVAVPSSDPTAPLR